MPARVAGKKNNVQNVPDDKCEYFGIINQYARVTHWVWPVPAFFQARRNSLTGPFRRLGGTGKGFSCSGTGRQAGLYPK